jgi:CBS domain-containing protein
MLAILVAILFLSLGLLSILVAQRFLMLQGDLIIVFLILLPIIVYAIFSGKLGEFKAAGLEAKFVTVARQSVEIASETIKPSEEDMQIVAKGGIRELKIQLQDIDESNPIILTLTLGLEGYYNKSVWLNYMEALSQYRNFKFVVILDQEKKFVAYIPSWVMLQILRAEGLGQEFVRVINQGSPRELSRYPGVVTKTISTKTTNLEALKAMTDQNLDALVVIDEEKRLKGVVEREQIVSKLLLGLAQ